MEFEGVVWKILPATQGTSARGEWKKQEVIFELKQEYSRKVCVIFFNKESDVARLKEGATYIVSVNIESREFNGRWYTDVRAWRVQPKQQEVAPQGAPAMPDMPPFGDEPSYAAPSYGASAAPAAPMAEVDDLPF
jgi:hypothetical protein